MSLLIPGLCCLLEDLGACLQRTIRCRGKLRGGALKWSFDVGMLGMVWYGMGAVERLVVERCVKYF